MFAKHPLLAFSRSRPRSTRDCPGAPGLDPVGAEGPPGRFGSVLARVPALHSQFISSSTPRSTASQQATCSQRQRSQPQQPRQAQVKGPRGCSTAQPPRRPQPRPGPGPPVRGADSWAWMSVAAAPNPAPRVECTDQRRPASCWTAFSTGGHRQQRHVQARPRVNSQRRRPWSSAPRDQCAAPRRQREHQGPGPPGPGPVGRGILEDVRANITNSEVWGQAHPTVSSGSGTIRPICPTHSRQAQAGHGSQHQADHQGRQGQRQARSRALHPRREREGSRPGSAAAARLRKIPPKIRPAATPAAAWTSRMSPRRHRRTQLRTRRTWI